MTNPHGTDPFAPNHELRPEDLRLKPERKHHRRDYIVPENGEEPELLIAPAHRHEKKKKKHPVLTVLLILLACLLGIVAIAAVTIFVLQQRGKTAMLPGASVVITAPEEIKQNPEIEIEIIDNGHTIKFNGATYRFNQNRANILCIGVDQESLGIGDGAVGTGGQADTLVLLSVDTKNGNMDALAISRDSLVDIDLFAEDGSFVGTENTQICLAYAYGDGREQSCDTTVRAVSRLLYGIPINTYFAIDLNTIAVLNDAIGGVEVNLLTEFKRTGGTMCNAGEVITLQGEEALRYVRTRDTEQLASNNDRMERQKQYLSAFAAKAIASTKNDIQTPVRLFDAVSDDAITTLDASRITFLATSLISHNQPLKFSSVAGEVVKGEDGYAEFHVDNIALYEQVLNIFYTKQ